MAKAIISRRNKKSGVDVIENNGWFWEKSYSGHYWSMPIKANGVWVLRSTDYANPKGLLYSINGINYWTQSNVTDGDVLQADKRKQVMASGRYGNFLFNRRHDLEARQYYRRLIFCISLRERSVGYRQYVHRILVFV